MTNIAKVIKLARLKFLSCARPELVEGYLRAHLEILDLFKTAKNLEKSAQGNPSTSSGRARKRIYLIGY